MDQLAYNPHEAETEEEMLTMHVMQHSPCYWWRRRHFCIHMCHLRELRQEYANAHFFSLTLKYTRPLCQWWMSFVFPETGAPVEMFTFSFLLILWNLNKGNFNGGCSLLALPAWARRHGDSVQPTLEQNLSSSQSVSRRSPQHSALSGI